jgi:hypothetical protein
MALFISKFTGNIMDVPDHNAAAYKRAGWGALPVVKRSKVVVADPVVESEPVTDSAL